MLKTSERGEKFIADHEGIVLRAYKDVAGVWTIGVGHTARAGGLKPKAGMKITRAEAMDQLAQDLRKFEKRVNALGCFVAQAPFDGAVSFDFNTGSITKATWVKKYARGDMAGAAKSIMAWVKAGGRTVQGLVRRRKAERDLIFYGNYGSTFDAAPEGIQRTATDAPAPGKGPDPVVKEAQEILTAKGFNPGAIDGWMGQKTKAAVLAYQKAHPDLTNDGILGPATLSQLRRDAQAVKDSMTKGGGSVVGSGAVAWFSGFPWQWVVIGVLVAVIVYFGWRYRDVIMRRVNTMLGREVA